MNNRIIQVYKNIKHDVDLLNRIYLYLNNTISYVEKLIKVERRTEKIIMTEIEQKANDLLSIDQSLINGINADLILIPKYEYTQDFSIDNYRRDSQTNRVIISILNIPSLSLNQSSLTQYEAETILLHQMTHILGFQYEQYNYFPGGITNVITSKVDSTGKTRFYIKTPTVVEFAKNYYNCDNLIGVELDNQNNNNIPSSHWDSRILLGEYMNSELYTPEIVISDFTLALLEDSGWYQASLYSALQKSSKTAPYCTLL